MVNFSHSSPDLQFQIWNCIVIEFNWSQGFGIGIEWMVLVSVMKFGGSDLWMFLQTTSRRLADRKVERFEKNIMKRGAVPETTAKKGKDYPVGPILLGFFIFVVIGSCKFVSWIFWIFRISAWLVLTNYESDTWNCLIGCILIILGVNLDGILAAYFVLVNATRSFCETWKGNNKLIQKPKPIVPIWNANLGIEWLNLCHCPLPSVCQKITMLIQFLTNYNSDSWNCLVGFILVILMVDLDGILLPSIVL